MARRYVLPGNYSGPVVSLGATDPMVNVYNPRGMVTRSTSLATPDYYTLPSGNKRGLSIQRGVKTRFGTNDVVIGANGKPVAVLSPSGKSAAGKNQLAWVDTPQGRRLVVRRGPGAGGSAPSSGAGGGGGGTPAPVDPYADYNDYPFIKNYLKGLDTGYQSMADLFGTTEKPGPYLQAMTQGATALGNAYANIAQNYNQVVGGYATGAAQTAAQVAPPQVAGASGGVVSAPNMTALGSAQGMSAAGAQGMATQGAYNSTVNTLKGAVASGDIITRASQYASGLLGQYAQKRTSEKLRLDQWIATAKADAQKAKDDLAYKMAVEDNKNLRALIASGDKAAALDVTKDKNAASAAAASASASGLKPSQLVSGYRKLGPKAGAGWKNKPGAVQDINGDWWIPKAGGGGNSGGGTGTIKNGASMDSAWDKNWQGKPADVVAGVEVPGSGSPATWGTDENQKQARAAAWLRDMVSRGNFPTVNRKKKTTWGPIRSFLAGKGLDAPVVDNIISIFAQG